jgi:hypothetical protein
MSEAEAPDKAAEPAPAEAPAENTPEPKAAPASFDEVMKLVQAGKQDELPGIKKIENKLSDDSESLLKDAKSTETKAKPWEKNGESDAGADAGTDAAPKTLFEKLNEQRTQKVEAAAAPKVAEAPKDDVSTETKARTFLGNPAVQSMLPQAKSAFLQQKLVRANAIQLYAIQFDCALTIVFPHRV